MRFLICMGFRPLIFLGNIWGASNTLAQDEFWKLSRLCYVRVFAHLLSPGRYVVQTARSPRIILARQDLVGELAGCPLMQLRGLLSMQRLAVRQQCHTQYSYDLHAESFERFTYRSRLGLLPKGDPLSPNGE